MVFTEGGPVPVVRRARVTVIATALTIDRILILIPILEMNLIPVKQQAQNLNQKIASLIPIHPVHLDVHRSSVQ